MPLRSDYEDWVNPTRSQWESRRKVTVADWRALIVYHQHQIEEWENGRPNGYPQPKDHNGIVQPRATAKDKDRYISTHKFWIEEYTKAMNARAERDAQGDE